MKTKLVTAFLCVFVIVIHRAEAQNTMYFMESLPQILNYNPARMPKTDIFIGFPGVNHGMAELYNSGFKIGDLITYVNDAEEDDYNPEMFVKNLGIGNSTISEARIDLISFGFRLKQKSYFSFSVSQRGFLEMKAPAETFYLMADEAGYDEKMPLNISGVNLRINAFSQIGFTYSRIFFDKLSIGISPKLLGANFSGVTENLKIKVYEEEEGVYETEVYGTSKMGLPVAINPSALENDKLDNSEILPEEWWRGYGIGDIFRNAGFLMDLGVSYDLNRRWSFSASMLDAGGYRWKKHDYLFTYSDTAVIVSKNKSFGVHVPVKLFWAASYKISDVWKAGFVVKNMFYNLGAQTAATLSLNGDIGRMMSVSCSYTAAHRFDNVGFGLRLRFFPGTDLFFITDNFIHVFNYRKIQEANLSVGINIAPGIKGKF